MMLQRIQQGVPQCFGIPGFRVGGAAFQFFNQEYWEGVNPSGVEELKNKGQALYRPLTTFTWATFDACGTPHGLAITGRHRADVDHCRTIDELGLGDASVGGVLIADPLVGELHRAE